MLYRQKSLCISVKASATSVVNCKILPIEYVKSHKFIYIAIIKNDNIFSFLLITMAGLYFGIASLILGIAIITYIIRVIRKEGTPQPYFRSVAMGIMFILLGLAFIIPYL